MNRAKLRQTVEDLERLAAGLRSELEHAGEPDAFAIHIYRSRREFQEVSANGIPRGPAGRMLVVETYKRAKELGFQGQEADWLALLNAQRRPPLA